MIDPLPPATTGYGAALLQTLLSLVAVCVVAWVVLKWAATRGFAGASQRRLEVIDRVMLDARRAVFLVRAGKRVFLLGGSDHAVTVLAELDPSEVPPPDDRAKTPSPKTFAELLVRARSPAPRPDETL